MDDPKKPKMDPIFERLLEDFNLRPIPGRAKPPPKPKFDPFVDLPDLFLPTLDPDPRNWGLPRMPSPREMIAKMMDDLQTAMGPPKPLSEPEGRLYSLAVEMGYRVVQDTQFGVDHDSKKLMTDMNCKQPMRRLLATAHEIGHMRRLARGLLSREKSLRWHQGPAAADLNLRRYIMAEEILAWREGMSVLRGFKVKFTSLAGVREFRATCLSTYRFITGLHKPAFRRLGLKEG